MLEDHCDDKRVKIVFHNTTPDLQDQDQDCSVQDQDQEHSTQDQDRFVWSQTGLALRPTVSDHITGHNLDRSYSHNLHVFLFFTTAQSNGKKRAPVVKNKPEHQQAEKPSG